MQAAEARELRVLQARDRAEDARLFAVLQLRLEADHVVERAERVVLAQLHDGEGAAAGVRIGEADRLHRAEAQGLGAAFGHHFDGQARFEIGRVFFPILERRLFAGEQRVDEGAILRFVHRAVDVVGAVALCRSAIGTRRGVRSIDSLCTMGAMASKKASESSPVSA